MELRQLQYFVKAAETMNFTEAAAAVFITQSTLSQQIKQLEEELGMLLFDRIGKHVRITEAGHVFLTHARKILMDVQKGKQAIAELNNAATGELNVGVSYAFTSSLFPVLAPFSTKYPGIKIFITSDNHVELEKKLRLAELDLIVAYHNESDDEDLEMQPLFSSSIVMVVAKNNPLAQLKSVNLKQLSELELILPGKGFSSRTFINELFYKNKMSPHIASQMFSFSISFCTGFYLNRYVVFKESGLSKRGQLSRFIMVNAICILLNLVFLKLLVDVMGLYPTPAKIIATIFIVFFSYFSQTHFFFKKKKPAVSAEDGQ